VPCAEFRLFRCHLFDFRASPLSTFRRGVSNCVLESAKLSSMSRFVPPHLSRQGAARISSSRHCHESRQSHRLSAPATADGALNSSDLHKEGRKYVRACVQRMLMMPLSDLQFDRSWSQCEVRLLEPQYLQATGKEVISSRRRFLSCGDLTRILR